MRALVLLNPAAQDGRAGRLRAPLEDALDRGGVDAHLVVTERPGDAERVTRERAPDADAVWIAGGDGTIHEAVNGLVGSRTPLGVLPLGTGNDFALALGMPSDLRDAVNVLARTPPVLVDVGRVTWTGAGDAPAETTRYFANSLGAGFDAHAARLASETKWLGGRTAYLAAVLRTLWAWRKPGVHVHVEFEREAVPAGVGGDRDATVARSHFDGPLFLCEVGNGHSVGGGFLLTPDARPDDGVLDVCLVRHLPPARALRLLPRSFSGGHVGAAEVTMDRVVALTVAVETGAVALQADGEALTFAATGFRVEVVPGALAVLAPGLR